MKKINWKIFNIAMWVEIVLAYVLPFKIIDNFEFKVGFPISFISVYNAAINHNPMMSMNLNPVAFLINGVIIYFIILGIKKGIRNFKH